MSLYDPKNETSGVRVYQIPINGHGSILDMRQTARQQMSYADKLTICGLNLTYLRHYARNFIETDNFLDTFTRNIPDPTGSNGTYAFETVFRASYGKINGEIYSKINWDEFNEQYNHNCKSHRGWRKEKYSDLEEAADFIAPLLKEAEQQAKIFKPKKITKDLEELRTFHTR